MILLIFIQRKHKSLTSWRQILQRWLIHLYRFNNYKKAQNIPQGRLLCLVVRNNLFVFFVWSQIIPRRRSEFLRPRLSCHTCWCDMLPASTSTKKSGANRIYFVLCPRQESNLYQSLRRALLYPLSYGGLKLTYYTFFLLLPQPFCSR